MRVAFRVDGNGRMGGGHLMRCLTLADALAARGAQTRFLCAAAPDALRTRIIAHGHSFTALTLDHALPEGPDWDTAPLSAEAQCNDAQGTCSVVGAQLDWLIVDHYLLDRRWQEQLRPRAGRILVIDDLANRPHDCDLLIDQTFGRSAEDYRRLVPEQCEVRAGADYALLRPEFAAARSDALRRRSTSPVLGRLMISLGTTDIGGITAAALRSVISAELDLPIDVVLAAGSPSLAEATRLAERHGAISLHIDTDDMASLMAGADLAIGAAGTTSWERCCLGLPALTFVLAANQRLIAERLEAAGAHKLVSLEPVDMLGAELRRLRNDNAARRAMAEAAASVTDGRGVERIADLMLARNGEDLV